jgi:hypothetical protein
MSGLSGGAETAGVSGASGGRRGVERRPGVSVQAIAGRIDASPDEIAALLDEELARGRVRPTDAGGWAINASAFAPDVVAALRSL